SRLVRSAKKPRHEGVRPRRGLTPLKAAACGSRLSLGCRFARPVAQMRDHVGDVRELLLEIALMALEALEQILAVRERPVEERSPAAAPVTAVMSVVHVHLPCEYRLRKRSVRSCERRSASAHWSSSAPPCSVSEYVRLPSAHSEVTSPSSSSARRRRETLPIWRRCPPVGRGSGWSRW